MKCPMVYDNGRCAVFLNFSLIFTPLIFRFATVRFTL